MKPKAFSYSRIQRIRDALLNDVFKPYIGVHIEKDALYGLHEDTVAFLPDKVSSSAVFDSFRILSGKEFTRKEAALLAWRIAGNIPQLINGRAVVPWSRQIADEIVPVQLESIRPSNRKNVPGFIFNCRALAGTPCAMSFPEFVSVRSCSAISRALGFSAPWGIYPYRTPYHFVNLLFFAHIEADKSHERPAFTRITASSSMVKANRELIAVRCRADQCPLAFEHACEQCYFGYDQCNFAVRPKTYITRYCPQCNSEGFFVPGSSATNCIACRNAAKTLTGSEVI
jgi:hypothetical protein